MVETIPYTYTSRAEMASIFSTDALDLRVDEDEDDSVSAGEEQLVTDCIEEATDICNQYCLPTYDASAMADSLWVRRRCSYIACYLLSIRRGHAPQYTQQYNSAIEDFKAIFDGKMVIPRLAPAYDLTPALSNLVVDDHYARSKIRVQPETSTGNVTKRQDLDQHPPQPY